MTRQVLAFEQAPPLSVPLRFFLTAPLFALAADAVLAWGGPDALVSRWTPALLAATHLMTLGFLTMVMAGALLQLLPVVAGAPIPAPKLIGTAVHVPLAAGSLALAAGLGSGTPALLRIALPLLAAGLGVLLWAASLALWRARADGPVMPAIRLALGSLAATAAIGSMLAGTLAGGRMPHLANLADLHLQWGLIGWVGLLVAGVATRVVPMFQGTPHYSQPVIRWFARFVFAGLAASTIAESGLSIPGAAADLPAYRGMQAWLVLSAIVLAGYTLHQFRRRRGRTADAGTVLWVTGMLCAIAAALLWGSAQFWPPVATSTVYAPLLGMLLVPGFGASVVNAMLYKIVPFLAWLAMLNASRGRSPPPNVKLILPAAPMRLQARLHLLALVLLCGAAILPDTLMYPALAAHAASSLLLWGNLAHPYRVYRGFMRTGRSAVQPGR